MTASTGSRRWHIVKWQTRASRLLNPSPSFSLQYYVLVYSIDFCCSLMLLSGCANSLRFLRCSLLLVCFLQSPKQSPVTFPQNAKKRLHHCNSLGVNIPPISLQCHCLPDSFAVLLAKQLWKSPLVFFIFLSYFPSIGFEHLNFSSHWACCQVGLVHEVKLVDVFYYRKGTLGLRLTNKPCWVTSSKFIHLFSTGCFDLRSFLLQLNDTRVASSMARERRPRKEWGDWKVGSCLCLDGETFLLGEKRE